MEIRINICETLPIKSPFYDEKTKTFLFENLMDQTIYFTYENAFLQDMKISIKNSKIHIIETFIGSIQDASYQIDIDASSSLQRLSILVDTKETISLHKKVFNDGHYTSMQIDLSASHVLNTEDVILKFSNASTSIINGIYSFDHFKKDYQTNLLHEASDTTSKAQIFAINHDFAHVNIFTDAYIKRGACRSKANQEGRIINLSNTCSGIVLPNLHIDENDVEASHSCSVGSVNKDHLYYLQSRGFSTAKAESILIKGYFNPLLQSIEDEKIKDSLSNLLTKRIG